MKSLLLCCLLLVPEAAPAQWADSVRKVSVSGAEKWLLPMDQATRNFGFFCRQELRLEQTIRLPVRLRIGRPEDCDRLEGKQRPAW